MMAGNLSIGQRKWILNQYWKNENAERVRTAWVEVTLYTIYCIPTFGPPCSFSAQFYTFLVTEE
jgi:hypothetical protein